MRQEQCLKQIAAAEKAVANGLKRKVDEDAAAKLESALLESKRRRAEIEHEISVLQSYLSPEHKPHFPVRLSLLYKGFFHPFTKISFAITAAAVAKS